MTKLEYTLMDDVLAKMLFAVFDIFHLFFHFLFLTPLETGASVLWFISYWV